MTKAEDTLPALDPGTIPLLRGVSTATITLQLLKRGFRNVAIDGVRPVNPQAVRLVGPAFTLRFIPLREDIGTPALLQQPESPQRRAIETVPTGEVLVIDAHGEHRSGTLGAILVARLKARGVAGAVSDGAVRDSAEIAAMAYPVFSRGVAAPPNFTRLMAVDAQQPIGCGGVAVYPGDLMVGDSDGVVAIPRHLADEVARDGAEQEKLEIYLRRRIERGDSIVGVYPASDETLARYRRWREAGEPDDLGG
jgi:regulator of RNase E activity RraA